MDALPRSARRDGVGTVQTTRETAEFVMHCESISARLGASSPRHRSFVSRFVDSHAVQTLQKRSHRAPSQCESQKQADEFDNLHWHMSCSYIPLQT